MQPREDETEEERRKREKKERKRRKQELKEKERKRKELEELRQQKEREQSFEIISLMPARRLYGVKLSTTVYLATMVELPCIIEAMKTLDTFNYFKS